MFISSFRARLMINVLVSYALAYGVNFIIIYATQNFKFLHTNFTTDNLVSGIIILVLFIFFFFRLTDITLRYINYLSERIQEVSYGNYEIYCQIKYDDELGMLAANINALARILKEKEEESAILKENERLAYDAERNAENQKNELISNVAHDLRTPLTTIIGYLELIKDNSNMPVQDIQNYATIAYGKSRRLQTMMDDLFEYTKLDQAEVKINLAAINLSELILQMTDEFYPSFQDHNIVPVVIIRDQNIYVEGDGQLLARVFDNLISNAIKYGYDNSELKVEVVPEKDEVSIKVINQGDTIDQADLPYLFDKFYRTDTSRSTSTGGTGLGLAITKHIIEMHNGSILVTSHNNVTTFVVILPRIQGEM